MSAAGKAVSQHRCGLCSGPAGERALPGVASSDPTPVGRQVVILGGPGRVYGVGVQAWVA